jgi:3-oxoacyl-[acyl-carrier protein] reductase
MAEDLVLITGASSDIGLALARQLLRTTPSRIMAHSFRGNERIAALQQEFPERVVALQADFSDAAAITEFSAQVALDMPSAVVHLPALRPHPERFTKFAWEHFERDLTVQLRSLIILLQPLLPKMTKLPRARIVFMLSSYVHGIPPKYLSQYTVIKYAQLGLMRALAAEYGATPVRINAVSPSMVETQFLSDLSELVVQGAAAANPLGRNATPEDVIGAILFLLSPASDYINGVTIPVAAGTVN